MILELLNDSFTDFKQEHGTCPDYLLISSRLNHKLQQELALLAGSSPECLQSINIIEADHTHGIQYMKK